MKKLSTYFGHLLLIGAMLMLTACPQRPNRPNPDQTLSGMGPGELEFGTVGSDSDNLFIDGSSGLEMRDTSILEGEQVRNLLEPIYFEFDRATLSASERDKAMAAAEYLRANPQDRLLIEGHCDWRGTTEYNLGLGDRRASSVKDYLVSLGIERDRIEVLSKGDLEATQGASEDQMARDRRAELVVLKS